LVILFTDLPQLLYIGSVAITGIVWATVLVKAQKDMGVDLSFSLTTIALRVSYALIFTLYWCFVALNIAYAVLESKDSRQFTCGTTDEEKNRITNFEACSIAYKAIFAFFSVLIALTFAVQSRLLIALLTKVTTSTENLQRKAAMRDLVISFEITACWEVCGLLIQAAIAIYCVITSMDNTTKLALIIGAELLPTYCLVYIFRPTNPWTRMKSIYSSSKKTSSNGSGSPAVSASSTGKDG